MKSQANDQANAGVENHSLLDHATWLASDRDSSPTAVPPRPRPIQEREISRSNLAFKTPVPRSASPLLARNPAPNRPVLTTKMGSTALAPPSTRLSPSNKARFSALARDGSDHGSDIEEFGPQRQHKSPVILGKRNERIEPSYPIDEGSTGHVKRPVRVSGISVGYFHLFLRCSGPVVVLAPALKVKRVSSPRLVSPLSAAFLLGTTSSQIAEATTTKRTRRRRNECALRP